MTYRDDHGWRSIPTKKLIEILQTLPAESSVYPNTVGNLLVLVDGVGVGAVNVATEEFENWSNDSEVVR